MKILIFSGGTGSRALQIGLTNVFGKNIEYTVLANFLDNGLSTGIVRKVADGKILGPSDLRKNQCLRHELLYGYSPTLKFLDRRITNSNPVELCSKLKHELKLVDTISETDKTILIHAIDTYFSQPLADKVDYFDFSVANILYAGVAIDCGYSLWAAGKIFERILAIPQNSVIGNSDESVYLQATTKSGYTVLDEGDLVSWSNSEDPIVGIHTVDINGDPKIQTLSDEAELAIRSADLIIFSAGTQWSSLIPTYISNGFKSALASSKAKKYLIMNLTEDKDSYGVGAIEWKNTLETYLTPDVKYITSMFASESMRLDGGLDISNTDSSTHNPNKLIKYIMLDYFSEYLNKSNMFVFDYDDTLIPRNSQGSELAMENAKLYIDISSRYNTAICSGNSINSITGFNSNSYYDKIELRVFADNGLNEYIVRTGNKVLDYSKIKMSDLNFTNDESDFIIKTLEKFGFNLGQIQNRNGASIAIKPVDQIYRNIITNMLQAIFVDTYLLIRASGRTTIEITKRSANKSVTVKSLAETSKVVYIGDEFENGNDAPILGIPNVLTLSVNSPKDTNIFLKVLNYAS